MFAVLLHDLITQAFDRYNRTGEPLDPRLLILLDEAANTPLPKLPQWSSTITGAGMQLVTVWQSKAQLDQIYSRDADNVLTNHRTKLFYPSGLSDMATIEYISNLVGTEHVRSDLDETGWKRAGERLPSRSPSTAVALLTPSVLRQMPVGDALLLHGDLPPAWVRSTGEGPRVAEPDGRARVTGLAHWSTSYCLGQHLESTRVEIVTRRWLDGIALGHRGTASAIPIF